MDEIEEARLKKEMSEDLNSARCIADETCNQMKSAIDGIDDSVLGRNIKAAVVMSEAGLPFSWGQIMGVLLADAIRMGINKQAIGDYVASLLDVLFDGNQQMGGHGGI